MGDEFRIFFVLLPYVNGTYPKTDKEAMMQIPQSGLLSTGTMNRLFDNTAATCVAFYDGYPVSLGEAAGQSVFHCHMHLIPRYKGDVPNPKGGVRGVIPSKQKY